MRKTRVVRINEEFYKKLKAASRESSMTQALNSIIEESILVKKPTRCEHCTSSAILYGRTISRGYVLCLDCGKVTRHDCALMADVPLYNQVWLEERGDWIRDTKERLKQERGAKCAHCGIDDETRCYLQLDHKIPQLFHGSDADENLQILCASCNAQKHIHLTEHELVWIKDTRTIAGFLDKIINYYKSQYGND